MRAADLTFETTDHGFARSDSSAFPVFTGQRNSAVVTTPEGRSVQSFRGRTRPPAATTARPAAPFAGRPGARTRSGSGRRPDAEPRPIAIALRAEDSGRLAVRNWQHRRNSRRRTREPASPFARLA